MLITTSKQSRFHTIPSVFIVNRPQKKILKAYLVANQRPYPITHDLMLMLQEVIVLDENAKVLREELIPLVPYAVEIRYPDDSVTPSLADAREARTAVEKVYIKMVRV